MNATFLHTAASKAPVSFGDLDQDPNSSVDRMTPNEIQQNAHIVNGGEATFPCPSCKGSGMFKSYSGRTVGSCFKCKGAGKVSKHVAAAAKGKVTREQNRIAAIETFREEHAAEYEFIHRNSEWSEFYRTIGEKLNEYGSLTDGQMAAVRNGMVKAAEKRAAKAVEREKLGGAVDVSAIEALFNTARASGLKRLAFRTTEVDISAAKETGKNPGALYVKQNGEYVGKIAAGKFVPGFAAKADTMAKVLSVAADPLGMAKFYGRETGKCSCCGRELTDPVSVEAGIGPICAAGWGL